MSVYSFQKGFNQVTVQEARKLRNDLKEALKINSRPAWLNRLRGNVEPKVSEAKAIEEVFAEYGITEIWGE